MRTAAYCRYSSDQQRAASLEDQARNILEHCKRSGWAEPTIYSDAAMSGSRDDRPGYRQLLADAASRRFDVLLVDDLSRLSRDSAETTKVLRRLSFHGIRLVGVSDGTDTARDGHELDTGIRGVISEHYLRDLGKKTHRGLSGRALSGANAGGIAYGYRVTSTGQRSIEPAEAEVVRRIFRDFAAGATPRQIAAALNTEHVPASRGGAWRSTAIYGDTRRGIGILANSLYVGRQIWNRSKWVKHPDTGRPRRIERPESEWIITEAPNLAIVDAATWSAAQARLKSIQAKTQEGLKRGRKGGGGAQPRYLLSGLLRCGGCGGALVMVDYYRYGCAARRDQGKAICASPIRIPRARVERALLDSLREQLLTESAFKLFEQEMRAAIKEFAPDLDGARHRVKDAERTRANIMAALRAGIITPGTKAALIEAEKDVQTAQAALQAVQAWQPSQIIPRARETWRRMVEALDATSRIAEAREAVREAIGDRIVITKKAGAFFAEVPASERQLTVVAGAGFEPTTFGL